MATAPVPQASTARRSTLAPTVLELLFLALVAWLIAFTVTGDSTGMGLLRDSQTGYHIRVGEYVLEQGSVPDRDFLSFTRANEPFYAWEWLSGVIYAQLNRWSGLRGIVVLSALTLGFAVLLMLRHMAWRGANIIVIVALMHLGISASSIHYLARPHVFTLLFFAGAAWLLDRDMRQGTRWVWLLIPMTALWANLHGGFFGLLVSLGILVCGLAAESMLHHDWKLVKRWGLLLAGCFAASLLNPYGLLEHQHIVEFMQESWYKELTEEFQPPRLLSSNGAYYTILLGLGVLSSLRQIWTGQFAWGLMTLAWAYASSTSMRHIPLYIIAAMPLITGDAIRYWQKWFGDKPSGSWAGILQKIAKDYQPSLRNWSLTAPVVCAVLLVHPLGIEYPEDFPEAIYPKTIVDRNAAEIGQAKVFTSDGWGHYLTYRYPPPFGIYVDGRCDFFGEQFTQEYLDAMRGEPHWQQTFERYGVNMALLPPNVGLAEQLQAAPDWVLVDRDPNALLFARRAD